MCVETIQALFCKTFYFKGLSRGQQIWAVTAAVGVSMRDGGQLGHKPPAVRNPAAFTLSSNPSYSLTPTLGPAERTGSDQGTQ